MLLLPRIENIILVHWFCGYGQKLNWVTIIGDTNLCSIIISYRDQFLGPSSARFSLVLAYIWLRFWAHVWFCTQGKNPFVNWPPLKNVLGFDLWLLCLWCAFVSKNLPYFLVAQITYDSWKTLKKYFASGLWKTSGHNAKLWRLAGLPTSKELWGLVFHMGSGGRGRPMCRLKK